MRYFELYLLLADPYRARRMIMGFLAKKKADEDPANYGGRGMALGGMIAGAVGTLLFIVLFILQIFFGVLNEVMKR